MIPEYMPELFVLLFLIVLTYIDLRKKEFPSILTSGLLFAVAIFQFENMQFGILAFILGWFLMEAGFFDGMADLKVITVIGFFIVDMKMFFLFTIIILVFGTIYKILMVWVVKQKEETAFIPVLLAVYITLMIIQYLI